MLKTQPFGGIFLLSDKEDNSLKSLVQKKTKQNSMTFHDRTNPGFAMYWHICIISTHIHLKTVFTHAQCAPRYNVHPNFEACFQIKVFQSHS